MTSPTRDGDYQAAIETHLQGNVLHCRLTGVAQTEKVVWTLHRGDFDPRRASAPTSAGASWSVTLPEITNGYVVRADVNGVVIQSEWHHYFNKDVTEKYAQWRKRRQKSEEPATRRIPLFQYEEPFENIAVVGHLGVAPMEPMEQLARENGLRVERHTGLHWPIMTVLSGNGSRTDSAGNQFVFSGVTRSPSRLLFGSAEVANNVEDVRTLNDEIGEFHLLTWDDKSVKFGHDYIGQGHIFYYVSDEVFAAANGLHLLALILQSVGVGVSIDIDNAKAKFFSTSYPFETESGLRTDFEGIRRLSVYERIVVTQHGVHLEKTQLWADEKDGEFSAELYEDLLHEAARDIIDNVEIALAHPRFENVVVELSAGLDSRIIFSALTNLPPSEKVRVYTRRGAEEKTASAINSLYRYAWDDLARIRSFDGCDDDIELPRTSHSVFMDGYYIESMFKVRDNYATPTLVLTGHGGEAFSRVMSIEGFFARDFAGELPARVESTDYAYANVVRYIGNHQVWLEAGKRYFGATLAEALEQSPSAHFPKRFAGFYVSERNPFVGGSVFRGAMSGPQWRPLQSKALYRLKARWFQHEQDYRLQFDLIRTLNPLISEVPYHKPVVEARKQEFGQHRPAFSIKGDIEFESHTAALDASRAAVASRAVFLPSRDAFDARKSAVQEYEESADSFLAPLRIILDSEPEFEEMGLPLFSYVQKVMARPEPRMFSKRHNVRNKLHILLQEVLIAASGSAAG